MATKSFVILAICMSHLVCTERFARCRPEATTETNQQIDSTHSFGWAAHLEHDTSTATETTPTSVSEKPLEASTVRPHLEEGRELEDRGLNEATTLPATGGPLSDQPDANEVQQAHTTISTISTTTDTPESSPETTSTTSPPAADKSTASKPSKKEVPECIRDTYCLHGGTCVVNEHNQMTCICPEEYYGERCQTKNICKTIIHDSLTGEQICAQIGRQCLRNDKFFRCECNADEFFVFKAEQAAAAPPPRAGNRDSTIAYDSLLPLTADDTTSTTSHNNNDRQASELDLSSGQQRKSRQSQQRAGYVAQCNKIDKCLGVRCRQMSEVCLEGECACNHDLGFIRDPSDKLCKLLDPCRMPSEQPVCGQARCVATYDKELFRCICPVGYKAVKKDEQKSSTQCAPLTNNICRIPLLNKCQHICKVDRYTNSYKCSCFHGYRPGSRPGVDDHMCFFDERAGLPAQQPGDNELGSANAYRHYASRSSGGGGERFVYRAYSSDQLYGRHERRPRATPKRHRFAYDNRAPGSEAAATTEAHQSQEEPSDEAVASGELGLPRNIIIKREPAGGNSRESGQSEYAGRRIPRFAHDLGHRADFYETNAVDYTNGNHRDDNVNDEDDELNGLNLNLLTAQERCNMYCEDNKICVLEQNSRDSYKCVCDRQGYVSIGDRCLDWCSAAEFSHYLKSLLDEVCYSGVCRPGDSKPPRIMVEAYETAEEQQQLSEEAKFQLLLRESSWRPSFECDCSTSPLLEKDPETKLCKLNLNKIIEPCLPGGEGYIDCVQNKNAYCTVLHRPTGAFFKDLQPAPATIEPGKGADSRLPPVPPASAGGDASEKAKKAAKMAKDKLYTCVCSPEKKFLVDKPRNKARCINECNLLNNECGRFNRMCRAATIDPEEFGHRSSELNLVSLEDAVDLVYRMAPFKRTGCECLPGFNVGPSESVDFFLDNDYQGDPFEPEASLPPFVPTPVATLGGGSLINPAAAAAASLGDQVNAIAALQDSGAIVHGEILAGQGSRAKYMNINSRCLLDYDVIEFHATFKAPANFAPAWIDRRNTIPLDKSVHGKFAAAGATQPEPDTRNTAGDEGPKVIKDDSKAQAGATSAPPPTASPFAARGADKSRTRANGEINYCKTSDECLLKVPDYMRTDISEFHKKVVLVAQCDVALTPLSLEAYQECIRYRYWVVQKLLNNFADWRRVMAKHLKGTFDLMDGNIRLRVNKCEATIKQLTTIPSAFVGSLEGLAPEWVANQLAESQTTAATIKGGDKKQTTKQRQARGDHKQDKKEAAQTTDEQHSTIGSKLESQQREPLVYSSGEFDPLDQYALIDADVDCELTIHSANDETSSRHMRKVLLEKQLPRLIFKEQQNENFGKDYYLMAPRILVHRDSIDQLPKHRKVFSPCKSEYAYCDSQTRCAMVDIVNFSCTCEYGYTPIGSRDIYQGDSRKEVCEDIDECLFDVCKENGLENKSICINEIGDYKCQCIRHHVGDNKRYCNHICNIIACKYGDCRIPDEHHAYCECYEGYREADCSVQDPSVALRKANMIICGSIFTSVLLLAITLAISLNSQLKKTKKKLKRLEAANDAVQMFDLPHQQPFRPRLSKVSSG